MNIYLSDEERGILEDVSRQLGYTQAYIMRLAFREMMGLALRPQDEGNLAYIRSGHVRYLTHAKE